LQPAFRVPEGEITDLLKKRPDAAGLMWKVSDVKMGLDEKGNPTYQYVYEGYDLNKDVPITEPTLKLWKQAGLHKSHPELFKLKTETKVSANNYKAFQQLALSSLNVALEKQKAETDIELRIAQTEESRARALKDLADAKREDKALQKDALFTAAMKAYDAAGKDFSKIGSEYQGVIAEHASKLASGLAPLYKQAVETGQNDVAQAYAQKIKDLTDLSQAAFTRTLKLFTSAEGKKAFAQYKAKFDGNSDFAVAAMLQDGWTMPPAAPQAAPPPEPSLFEKAKGLVGGAVGTAKGVAGRALGTLEAAQEKVRDIYGLGESKK
ncbi:MAG: hypothetical protein L0312_05730, partial [Acidobacteria bacterium]|nr:hypothetical protein [Acidobacteriota bacterium]